MNMVDTLEASSRTTQQHSDLKNLRDGGNIPAVVYGYQVENTPVYVSEADFIKTIRQSGRNGVISLSLNGKTQNVILSDYQQDSLKGNILHADFLSVNMSSEIEASVRIELVGESQGVKDGGVLQQPLHEVTVSAKPNDLPEAIQVDVTSLQVNDSLTIGDIKGKYSFNILEDDEMTIASVLAPRQEEEISTGEEQEPGTPDNLEGRETSPESE